MPRLSFRFYAELNDFLPRALRSRAIEHDAPPRVPLRDIIEGLGVPHTEIELVLVDGESVALEHVPADGSQVSVYPVFEGLDIAPLVRVRLEPLRDPRFVLDVHLGRLCAYLRMAGFDTLYRNDASDDALAEISSGERRILLTRDQGLLKRRVITHGSWIRNTAPRAQLEEVLRRFDLSRLVAPFTRCMRCNTPLATATPESIERRVPPRVRTSRDEYRHCPSCGRVYWKGSHYVRMLGVLAEALQGAKR